MESQDAGNGRPQPEKPIRFHERSYPPLGFIVDGGVAEALPLEFEPNKDGLQVAHSKSKGGSGIVVVRRQREYSIPNTAAAGLLAIEALQLSDVKQVIAISHRLLVNPEPESVERPNTTEALTVAVSTTGACGRLVAATFDRVENNQNVDGVFVRDEQEELDPILVAEQRLARASNCCVCVVDATTLRTDPESRSSEQTLAEVILSIPDALSPIASCYCRKPTRAGGGRPVQFV